MFLYQCGDPQFLDFHLLQYNFMNSMIQLHLSLTKRGLRGFLYFEFNDTTSSSLTFWVRLICQKMKNYIGQLQLYNV